MRYKGIDVRWLFECHVILVQKFWQLPLAITAAATTAAAAAAAAANASSNHVQVQCTDD